MERGICLTGFVALRSEPKSSAEMVSSLVFGEQYIVTKRASDWLKIKNELDGYEGWLSKSNHQPIELFEDLSPFQGIGTLQNEFTAETIQIGPGALIPKGKRVFELGEDSFELVSSLHQNSSSLIEIAELYLGTPYLWGGRSIYGIDCSGFVQMVFHALGIILPRDSSKQALIQAEQLKYNALESGDLAFFKSKEGKINHVGIVLPENEIIHASASVHIDTLTHKGILNYKDQLTHSFAWGIKKPSA